MIIPSIASANQLKLVEELRKFAPNQPLHIDIEDGNFVPNITFGMQTVKAIAENWRGTLDVHLLVTNPAQYIKPLAECGISRIAFHIESVEYPLVYIEKIKQLGLKPGLALNFKTCLSSLKMFIDEIDYLIIMTSEPDQSAQRFRLPAYERIQTVRNMLPNTKEVWADGGILVESLSDVYDAGADTVIMGRSIFQARDPKKELEILSLRRKTGRNGSI